jgi:hypothetical protein
LTGYKGRLKILLFDPLLGWMNGDHGCIELVFPFDYLFTIIGVRIIELCLTRYRKEKKKATVPFEVQ